MKKRKILYLFPLAALILSGCTFEEVMDNTKSFFGNNIVQPIKDLFDKITGKKKEEQKPSGGDQGDEPGGVVPGEDEQEETIHGSQENPLSVTEFMAELDKLIEAPESGTLTDRNNVFFIKGKATSNTEANDTYQISHLNIVDSNDSTKEVVAYYAELADDLGKYTAKNSLAGAEVVVKGYGAKFIDKSGKLNYEITDKSKNEGPAIILSAKFPEVNPDDNYGTLESPISVSEAIALIQKNDPTPADIYVTGTVTSNAAWSDQYSNVDIVISDGQNSIKIFRAADFPEGFDATAITQNSLKGKTVVASGKGTYYAKNKEYELAEGNKVHSIVGEDVPPVVIDNYGSLEAPLTITEAQGVIDLQDPTQEDLYVTGVVKSNTEWSTKYKNIDIVLSEGENELKLFRASKLPNDATPAADELVGKVVIAHGKGMTYSGTYELDQNCVVDSIADPVPVDVESVSLSSYEIDMEVGGHFSLEAFVHPNEANQEVEWNIEQEAGIVSFENNVITGLAVGTATITATSVENPDAKASCVVTVTEATKNLTGITVDTTNAKREYVEGDDYSAEGLVVTAHYSNAADEDVTAFVQWEFDPETATLGDESVSITAHYNEESSVNVIAVTVSEKEAEKGSEENPYTCVEARAAVDAGTGITGVYAKGIVNRIAYAFANGSMSFYFSDDGSTSNELEAFKLAASSDPGIEVGDNVVVTGNLTLYSKTSTYEFTEGCTLAEHTKPAVTSLVVAGTASQTEYAEGADYNHAGLTATAHYDNGVVLDVTTIAEWTIDPATASLGDESIDIYAEHRGEQSNVVTVNVTVSSDAPVLEQCVLQYTGTTTTNLTGVEADDSALLGAVAPVSCVSTKNSGTVHVGLNKDGTIRLYKGGSTTLTINVANGTIQRLDIVSGSTFDSLSVNGNAVSAAAANSSFSVNVGASSAALLNPGSSAQSWFISITVVYSVNS